MAIQFGTSNADVLYGTSGGDWIFGLGGDDHLVGGQGNDFLDGGSGYDTVHYSLEGGTLGVNVDLGAGWAKDTFGNNDTLINIENVDGTGRSDKLVGNGGNNILWGADGNDYIDGKGGSDWVFGGNGNDVLLGGNGNDLLYGGSGSDLFLLGNEVQAGAVDIIGDFNTATDHLSLIGYQGATSFGDYPGYGSASVNLGGGNTYTVLAAGVTGAQLQAQTVFV